MMYLQSYRALRELLNTGASKIEYENLDVYKRDFVSDAHQILPGEEKYYCREHDKSFKTSNMFFNDLGAINSHIHIRDVEIHENQNFSYWVFMPKGMKQADVAIFLFHGFNEKYWDKYLPWAHFLAEQNQCAVILFPIAFHMNRTLSIWSDKRKMFALSKKRNEMFPNVVNSSLTNVAISLRLHTRPQRFIWSGLQTYFDVIQFVEQCKKGENGLISAHTNFHFVSYSIGCLLAEILKLTNYNQYFDNSKLCLLCGGAVFNRLSPVSKYILDSEANIALYSYMVEHFEKHLENDSHLNHYINGPHRVGQVFYSMLDYKGKREYREGLFSRVKQDVFAIALKRDTIIPAYEVINTLQGALRDIDIPVDVDDFPFSYNHVTPFPYTEKNKDLIDEHFKGIFGKFSEFIKG
ncbi:MAG TPA: DUF6051 family protein [Sunxiuqinia sp.]|nr:DUF6051 family protein [Sunxiuqinia sp.]